MTGLLLMADFSRALQLPLLLWPSNQGQREQAKCTAVLGLVAAVFLFPENINIIKYCASLISAVHE